MKVEPLTEFEERFAKGARLRLKGDWVTVESRRGDTTLRAQVVTTIRPDTVFIPFHWVGANRLTNDALDPSSRMPEFKVCACAVGRAAPSGVSGTGP